MRRMAWISGFACGAIIVTIQRGDYISAAMSFITAGIAAYLTTKIK